MEAAGGGGGRGQAEFVAISLVACVGRLGNGLWFILCIITWYNTRDEIQMTGFGGGDGGGAKNEDSTFSIEIIRLVFVLAFLGASN